MSDILIRCMEMPKNCEQCWFFGSDSEEIGYCYLLKGKLPMPDGIPQDCPLIEIPPHGRLIDASEITEHKYTTIPSHRKESADGKPKSEEEIIAFKFGWNYAIDAIVENAPTIIPADVPDNNVGNISAEEGET